MTEFARLLNDAAGTPSGPLDMRAVRDRARRLGLGRWRLLIFGLIGLVGLGVVPVGPSVLPAGDRPAPVATVDGNRRMVDDADTDASPAATDATVASQHGASKASGVAASAPAAGEPTEGCQAWGNGEAIVVGFGLPPECTYTATMAGGYRTSTVTWQLRIVRDGRAILLGGESDLPCGEVGVVQPGDVVTARPWSKSGASAPGVLEVGPAYHC